MYAVLMALFILCVEYCRSKPTPEPARAPLEDPPEQRPESGELHF
jgi:hypothetical protein